jgi:glycosyltransferase 2 family protein
MTPDPPAVTASTSSGRRGRWVRLLGWVLSVCILAVAVAVLRGRWDAVGRAGGLPGPAFLAGAVALYLAANMVLASNWRRLVALVGPRLPRGTAWWIWSLSQLARYGISMAHVAGRALVGRRYGVTATAGAATTVLETAWYTSVVSSLALATIPWWLPAVEDLTWLAWAGVVPVAGLLAGLLHPEGLIRVVARLSRWGPLQRLSRGRFAGLDEKVRLRRRDTLRLTAWYLANTSLRLPGFLVLFAAVGGDVATDGLRAVGAYALGHLVGALAFFAPGGIGPREGMTSVVLAPVLGGGPAVLLALTVRLVEIVAELGFLGIARVARAHPAEAG